ncbi:hypothetical protein ABZ093_11240 [Streptomyces cyaneofuscatus]|uniref:hypothetical protein n=1 Tax=Streptomyces cyaneofuscatus TaxID=66883 RepID=UPI0033A65AD6
MAPRQTEWDFGLSRLTKFFAGPWSYDRTVDQTITDAALGHLGEPAGEAARAILADAVRLEQSSLSTEVIATVWTVASEGGYNLAYFGVDGRDWLRHVAAVCSEQARQADPAGTLVIEPVAASEESVRAVLASIAAAEPSLAAKAEAFFGHEPGEVVRALELVAAQVDPDLGFRLLLRVLGACRVPISDAQYAQYEALGEMFGYGRFHVSDVEHLTRW